MKRKLLALTLAAVMSVMSLVGCSNGGRDERQESTAGMYKDYQDAGDKTISISKVVKPRPEYKQIYEEKYAGYRTVVEALNPIWYQFENVWHQPTGRSMKSLFKE